MKKCLNCGKELSSFRGQIKVKKYCNPLCSSRHKSKQRIKQIKSTNIDYNFGVSAAIRGSISEFKVCIGLFEKGYEIFRPINPKCSFDMIIYKKETKETKRVEVKTIPNQNFKLTNKNLNSLDCDILAIVTLTKIIYFDYKTNEKIEL